MSDKESQIHAPRRDRADRSRRHALGGAAMALALATLLGGLAFASGAMGLVAAALHALLGVVAWALDAWLAHLDAELARVGRESETLRRGQLVDRVDDELDEASERLLAARRRTAPLVSVGLAGSLVIAGLLSARALEPALRDAPLGRLSPFLAGSSALVAAVLAFLVSRYLDGFARAESRPLARGAATWLAGSAALAFALAIACLSLASAGIVAPLDALNRGLPIALVVLGVEIVLEILLGAYRPKRAGDAERAPFDSRVIGLLAAPASIARTFGDAVNHQLGFELTRTWMWQLATRAALPCLLLGIAALLTASSFVIVAPRERALLTRFGRLAGEPLTPGLHVKLPWPISRTRHYDVETLRTLRLGSHAHADGDAPILWASSHASGERSHFLATTREPVSPGDISSERAVGFALAEAEIEIRYRIDADRLLDYVLANRDAALPIRREAIRREALQTPEASADGATADRDHAHKHEHAADDDELALPDAVPGNDDRLRRLAWRELSRLFLELDLESWLGATRATAGETLARRLQLAVDRERLGLVIVGVSVASVHPPLETADAFHAVAIATRERDRRIDEARRSAIASLASVAGDVEEATNIADLLRQARENDDASETRRLEREIEQRLLRSGGVAATRLAQARASALEIESLERGRVALAKSQRDSEAQAPRYFRARAALAAMRTGLENARKLVLLAHPGHLRIHGNFQDVEGGLGLFDSADASDER